MTVVLAMITSLTYSQKFITKTGHIWFYSSTPMENIEAHNKQSSSILDSQTGDVVVSVLMKSFEFEKALMQEHFNENYVESDKFPKGKFKGKINNLADIDFKNDGEYRAMVSGTLTIHGTAKDIETAMLIHVRGDALHVVGKFVVAPSDFAIEIPKMVEKNIASEIDVNVDMNFKPYKK